MDKNEDSLKIVFEPTIMSMVHGIEDVVECKIPQAPGQPTEITSTDTKQIADKNKGTSFIILDLVVFHYSDSTNIFSLYSLVDNFYFVTTLAGRKIDKCATLFLCT
jgi:hypothetical protein